MEKIFLSPPNINVDDITALGSATNFNSPEVANLYVERFENELAAFNGVKTVVALNSGTSALHLGLIAMGIKPGDKIILPTLTFAATAFAIKYVNATPVFIDVDEKSWTIDLDLVSIFLRNCKVNELPKAIIPVDLFGRTCDYEQLKSIADHYEIPIFIDAAESLGSRYKSQFSSSLGLASVLSFNSNKILTTTGGGAFLTNDIELASKVRYFANQAREKVHWYEHKNIGFNYRLSPILAALGSSQLIRLNHTIQKRINNRKIYSSLLSHLENDIIVQDSKWETSNSWLVNFRMKKASNEMKRDNLNHFMNSKNIGTRFIWKPLHQQDVFKKENTLLNGTADTLYAQSLCLPSGTNLTELDIKKICSLIKEQI